MIEDLLKSIDIFRLSPQLMINNQKYETSKTGGTISVIYSFVILYFIYFSGNDIFFKLNPKLVTKQTLMPEGGSMSLSPNNYFFGFQFEDEDSNAVDGQDSIIKFKVYHSKYTKIQGTGSSGSFNETITDLPVQKCSETQNELRYLYSEAQLSNFYCLANNNLSLGGEWTGNEVNILRIELHFCDHANDTTQHESCLPWQEQINKINGNYLGVYTNSFLIDHKNYTSPLQVIPHYTYYLVSSSIYKEVEMFLKTLQIQTDSGWLFEDLSTLQAYSINRITMDIAIRSEESTIIASIWVYMGSDLDYSQREYVKLLTIAANVGGIAKFFFIVVFWILKPIYERRITIRILNTVFDFKEQLTRNRKVELDNLITSINKRNFFSNNNLESIKKSVEMEIMKTSNKLNHDTISKLNVNECIKSKSESNNYRIHRIKHHAIRAPENYEPTPLIFNWAENILLALPFPKALVSQKSMKKEEIYFQAQSYLHEGLSIETIIRKLYEHEALKLCLFSNDQLKCFNVIFKPNFLNQAKQKIFEVFGPSASKQSRQNMLFDAITYFSKTKIKEDSINYRLLELVDNEVRHVLQSLSSK